MHMGNLCYSLPHHFQPSSWVPSNVAEAYHTIPITPEQWPGLVVKLLGDDQFAINICNNFGLTSAGGIYGHLGDAMLDIFRTHGIGPASKWVDDHIFFQVPGNNPAPFLLASAVCFLTPPASFFL